ncbi:hypothetical protein TEA_017317 [Camellia sinensis var. sinensis]|uniref:Protein TIC 214 n=1 Tax=Camellia sinensis var. sinensis TaxID=542762 RepID=A0A4V3WNW4_CAMSN|nr:hypothetical protein TEA_017317 [Camellia sinensis var. sinensis]
MAEERFLFEGTPGNRSSGDGAGPVAQRIRARGYEPRCTWLRTTVSGVRIPPRPQPAQKGRTFPSGGKKIMIGIADAKLLNLGPSYLFLLRARVMEEGTEKEVSATTGFITGQLMMFISIYYAPLHLALGRPHTITVLVMKSQIDLGPTAICNSAELRCIERNAEIREIISCLYVIAEEEWVRAIGLMTGGGDGSRSRNDNIEATALSNGKHGRECADANYGDAVEEGNG